MRAENLERWLKAGRAVCRSAFAIATLLSLALLPSPALADSDPSNDSDAVTVRLVPVVDLGVIIDTNGAAWAGSADLDTAMDLGTEKVLGTGVKVTVVGNLNIQELELQGAPLDGWTLDTDETDGQDQLRLYGLLAADGAAAPAPTDFGGVAHLISAAIKRAGQPQASEGGELNHTFELPTTHGSYADVDNMQIGAIRRLWLRANTPSFSSQEQTQRITVTITAVSGAGQ